MEYVSDCCGAEVFVEATHKAESRRSDAFQIVYCLKCHKLCTPIKAAVKKEAQMDKVKEAIRALENPYSKEMSAGKKYNPTRAGVGYEACRRDALALIERYADQDEKQPEPAGEAGELDLEDYLYSAFTGFSPTFKGFSPEGGMRRTVKREWVNELIGCGVVAAASGDYEPLLKRLKSKGIEVTDNTEDKNEGKERGEG